MINYEGGYCFIDFEEDDDFSEEDIEFIECHCCSEWFNPLTFLDKICDRCLEDMPAN